MAEEPPGGWELKRELRQLRDDQREGFAQMNARFDEAQKNTVSVGQHGSDIGRVNDRIAELAKDIVEERADRKEAIQALVKAQERTGMWLRWIATGLLVPVAVPLVLYLLNRGS